MPSQELEEWGSVHAFERRLPGPNRLLRRAGRFPDEMRDQHHGQGPDRFRMIAPERVAQRGLPIPALRVLDEDPEARERPQEPAQGGAMRMCGFRQFLDALGAAGDKIGKGEPGGNMDRLHRYCSWPQDLRHLHRWGDGLCLRFPVAHLCLSGMLSWRPITIA